MTQFLKLFSKALFVCTLSILSTSCSSAPEGSEKICNEISQLKGSDFSTLPDVISLYKNITDSITAVNPDAKAKIDKYIIEKFEENNDTLMIATHIITANPSEAGKWLGEYLSNKILEEETIETSSLMRNVNIANFLYQKSGNADSFKTMTQAVDQYISSLDTKKQAKIFTSISSPQEIGYQIAKESDSSEKSELIKEIQNLYSLDEASLKSFNNAINQ